jgi:hypothetical protein
MTWVDDEENPRQLALRFAPYLREKCVDEAVALTIAAAAEYRASVASVSELPPAADENSAAAEIVESAARLRRALATDARPPRIESAAVAAAAKRGVDLGALIERLRETDLRALILAFEGTPRLEAKRGRRASTGAASTRLVRALDRIFAEFGAEDRSADDFAREACAVLGIELDSNLRRVRKLPPSL